MLEEHSMVVLKNDFKDEEVSLSKGSRGAIISVHPGAYTIEFDDCVIITIEENEVEELK